MHFNQHASVVVLSYVTVGSIHPSITLCSPLSIFELFI